MALSARRLGPSWADGARLGLWRPRGKRWRHPDGRSGSIRLTWARPRPGDEHERL
ncbi:hypothetical protein [Phytohabitans houttuyneae]|uniref:hypothetical protein n=1 Tax=Phytohabitans houttuyneae TaxID=1076126 RepID=UPI001567C279|nr:hypothetical protein [Phytohabitans houttuyneae]